VLSASLLEAAGFVGETLGTALFERVSEKDFRLVALGTVILTGAHGGATAAQAWLS
jgi:hypothetical protein